MLKVRRILVSRSLMKTLIMFWMKDCSVMRPSLLESNILKNLSLIIPGKLQYSIKVTLSSFFSWMATEDRHLRIRSLYRSLK